MELLCEVGQPVVICIEHGFIHRAVSCNAALCSGQAVLNFPAIEKAVLIRVRGVVESVPVLVPRVHVDLSDGFTRQHQSHLTVPNQRRVAPVDRGDKDVLAIDDDTLVVEFRDLVATAHNDG